MWGQYKTIFKIYTMQDFFLLDVGALLFWDGWVWYEILLSYIGHPNINVGMGIASETEMYL